MECSYVGTKMEPYLFNYSYYSYRR